MLEVNVHSLILIEDKGVVFYIISERYMYLLYKNVFGIVILNLALLCWNIILSLDLQFEVDFCVDFFILHSLKYMVFSQ